MKLTPDILRGAADRLCPTGMTNHTGKTFMCEAVEAEGFCQAEGDLERRDTYGRTLRIEFEQILDTHGVSAAGALWHKDLPFMPSGPRRQALRFDFLNLLACEMETS